MIGPACDVICIPWPVCVAIRAGFLGRRTMARFGQQEPVAFLASWICAASRYTDRASHMEYKPGQAEVGAAIERGLTSGAES